MIPILGGIVTPAARAFGHKLSLGLTGAVMLGVTIFLFIESKKRTWMDGHWQIYGPLYLSLFGGLLMCADPVRHVLQDASIVDAPQYRHGCPTEDMKCLSVWGWLFTVGFTYVGIVFLVWGTMWNADLIGKCHDLRDKWREIRSAHDYQRV